MQWIILAITVSYFIGSIPTAYIFGRVIKGIDIRKFGSGNMGATNAWRILGKRTGIIVLLIDILKGAIALYLVWRFIVGRALNIPADFLLILCGMSCIFGHIWTVFLGFKGGKGIATTLGVLIGLAAIIPGLRLVLGLVILTWFVVFFALKIISVSSVVAAASLPIFMILIYRSLFLVLSSMVLSIIVILRHKTNLKRFFQGKEPRFSFKKSS
ncbi:MAG: glycerol-3-phosphate 1-O-acyltransferase PlsY [Candidatus Omnitrophica bacterium]|nr:glycerol-3-phosphate 1-O-acyltransferase PlsY [Candidatus Omnitrophota bacterium]